MSDRAEHTPEPWMPAKMPSGVEARQTDFWIVLGADDWLRAKACVDACAGIPTEQLEGASVETLFEALRLLTVQYTADHADDPAGDRCWQNIQFAQAALAPFRKDSKS